MSAIATSIQSISGIIETATKELVRVQKVGDSFFVNLPLIYPDGSFVTVRIGKTAADKIKISDAGFAFRESDEIDAANSFKRTANKIAERYGVEVGKREIFAEARVEELERAICDVAQTSWRVASIIDDRYGDEDDLQLTEELSARLKAVFGAERVAEGAKIIGQSTVEWPISAVVTLDGSRAAFQAVGDHPNSIYRTATAFRDLAALKDRPRLIAVVRNKGELGARANLLAPARIVEHDQADEFFRRAAA